MGGLTTGRTAYEQVPSEYDLSIHGYPQHIAPTEPKKPKQRLKGWRFSILLNSMIALGVFGANLGVAVTFSRKVEAYLGSVGSTVLFSGDCDKARLLNIGIHLAINILSTLLLGASNYGMQCLSAPTRREVDVAHAKRHWLDIGVLSFRNLKKISRKRGLFWVLLCLSSLPLHFFYNSAVFSTITAQDYLVFNVNTEALTGSSSMGFNATAFPTAVHMQNLYNNGSLDRLSPEACIHEYAQLFLSERRNLILVSDSNRTAVLSKTPYFYPAYTNDLGGDKSHGITCSPNSFGWICGLSTDGCGSPGNEFPENGAGAAPGCAGMYKKIDPTNWAPLPFKQKVDYCLAEPARNSCRIQFSPPLAGIVIVFNLLKVIVLMLTWLTVRENPLMTSGDAIASFLKRPDPATLGVCWLSKKDAKRWMQTIPGQLGPRQMRARGRTWASTIGTVRWLSVLALFTGVIAIMITCLLYAILNNLSDYRQHIMSLSLGAIDPLTFIFWSVPSTGTPGLISNVLIANLPQVVLSAIYFTYNGLWTCFMFGHEWNKFAVERKGLRVSGKPQGAQRSTYFLQLPYKFAGPLMLLSVLLHWLCSQSLFLVSIEFEHDKAIFGSVSEYPSEYITCGYSLPAIITTICVGFVMVIVAIFVGRKKYKNAMPIAGNCSAVISAACHSPPGEDGALSATQPVQWGHTGGTMSRQGPIEHCAFSARTVYQIHDGHLYAGLKND